jgi:hypothetical protein
MKWVARERPKIDRIATALALSLVSMSVALTAAADQTRRSDSMMRKACLGSVGGALVLVLAAVGASSVQATTMQRVPWS